MSELGWGLGFKDGSQERGAPPKPHRQSSDHAHGRRAGTVPPPATRGPPAGVVRLRGGGGFFGASVHLPGDQEFILEVSAGRGCLCVVLARAHSRPLGEVLGSGRGRGGSRQGKIKLSASLGFPNPRQVSVKGERPSGSRVHLSWRGSETKRLPEPERGPALCLLPAATLATVPPSSLAQGWGQSQGWSQGEVRAGIRVRAGLGSGSGQGSGTGLR